MKRNWQAFVQKYLGDLNYNPPLWMKSLWLRATANPRKSLIWISSVIVSLVVLIGGGLWIKNYYDSQPKPQFCTVSIAELDSYDPQAKEPRTLKLHFSESAARLDLIGKTVNEFVKMSPTRPGNWKWDDAHDLTFTPSGGPEKDWPLNQEFEIQVSPKALASQIRLEKNDFEYRTPNLSASVTKEAFYQDPRLASNKRIVATIRFNYPVDPESFKKHLRLVGVDSSGAATSLPFSNLSYSVSFNDTRLEAYLQTDPLPMPKENVRIGFQVESGVVSPWGGKLQTNLLAKADVPGKDTYFQIGNVGIEMIRNEKFEPEQVLMISASAELASETLLPAVEIYQLPPRKKSAENSQDSVYTTPYEVTPEVLAKARKITPVLIPTEEPITGTHSFKIEATPLQSLFVKVKAGVQSFGGYVLAKEDLRVVQVPEYPKELSIMSKGMILNMSGDRKLPMLSRNVDKVKYSVARIRMEHLNHLVSTMSGRFGNPAFDYGQITENTIAEKFEGEIAIPSSHKKKTNYFSLDLSNYLDRQSSQKKGLFYVRLSEAQNEYESKEQRLILVTDLGLIVKNTVGGQFDVFVQNLRSGAPSENTRVEILGANGLPILQATTDNQGRAQFPSLEQFKNEKSPVAILATRDGDLSFLPLNAYNQKLNYARFDVGGIRESSESDQLTAFVFSDRGIYRPGEKVELGMIVRSKNWNKPFQNLPVVLSIYNSRNEEVEKKTIQINSQGIEHVPYSTSSYFPTGKYTVSLRVSLRPNQFQEIGTGSFRVEEFLPDQLKLTATLSQQSLEGWVSPKDLKGIVQVNNLFGRAAEKREVRGSIRLIPVQPVFRKYKDYKFLSPISKLQELTDTLPATQTNDSGSAQWDLPVEKMEKALYKLIYEVEAFETTGGRSVHASLSQLVSDHPLLVGYKTVETDLSYLKLNSAAKVELIAVNPKLEKVATPALSLELQEGKYISSLVKADDGTYKYQSVYKESLVNSKKITISAKGATLALPTEKAGDFIYILKDDSGFELSRVKFTVVGEANVARSLEKSSEIILGLNKKDFNPGEEIEMQIKAPYAGSGLITIERDKVYATKWFKSTGSSSVQKIKIPDGVEGHAYVVVTMLRDVDSPEIYMSPLAYAVEPFAVNLASRKVDLKLALPEMVKPGQKMRATLTSDKPTQVVIYGVDEGILQVAGYKTPDPLDFFFQRRALQVATYQLLDQVIPDLKLLQGQAEGGDEFGGALGSNLNPFKRKGIPPVVFWKGPIAVSGSTTVEFDVPDTFNGSLKVMAVAANSQAFGHTEASTLVRGDFILTSTLPTFVAPNDQFIMNVIVSNQLVGSGPKAEVLVQAQTSAGLALVGSTSQTLDIPEGREKQTEFTFKANDLLGNADVTLIAGIGAKKAQQKLNLSVRPGQPYTSTPLLAFFQNTEKTFPVSRILRDELKKETFEVSGSPQVLISGISDFFQAREYYCSEQLLSRLLNVVVSAKSTETQKRFDETMTFLRSRQIANGGFAVYRAVDGMDPWVTLHAAMVFLEAKEKGYPIPEEMWKGLQDNLKTQFTDGSSAAALHQKAKALYLLTRMHQVVPNLVESLRADFKRQSKDGEKTIASAYFGATLKMLQQESAGEKLFLEADPTQFKPIEGNVFIDPNSQKAIYVYLAARHYPTQLKKIFARPEFENFLSPFTNDEINTYSAASTLLAVVAMQNQMASTFKPGDVQIDVKDANSKSLLSESKLALTSFPKGTRSISVKNPQSHPLFVTLSQSGFDREAPDKEIKNGIELIREYLGADGKPVSKVKSGDEITVRIRGRSIEKDRIQAVIVDLLPGGFEPVLTSLRPPEPTAPAGAPEEGEELPEHEPMEMEGDSDEGAQFRWLDVVLPKAYAQNIGSFSVNFVDVREDRVVLYLNFTKEAQEYQYKIKAISKGDFLIPPIQAKGLYQPKFSYQGLRGKITVE